MGEYLFATFFVPLYLNPLIAIWMTLSYTAKSGGKRGFARGCFIVALLSVAVYTTSLYLGVNWKALSLPSVKVCGGSIGTFIIDIAPTVSPLLCIAFGYLFIGKLRNMLPDYEPADIRRLIRLGVMAGHGAMSLPIGFYFTS